MFTQRSTLILAVSLALLSSVYAGPGGKGGGAAMGDGPLQFILDHDKELQLTNDQKRALKQLQSEMQDKMKKMRSDPEMAKLLEQAREAKKSGDEEKMKAAREAMRAEMEKDTGTSRDGMLGKIAGILNKDQMLKLKELRGSGEGDGAAKGRFAKGAGAGNSDEGHAKPDPAKGPPPVFDDSKKPASN